MPEIIKFDPDNPLLRSDSLLNPSKQGVATFLFLPEFYQDIEATAQIFNKFNGFGVLMGGTIDKTHLPLIEEVTRKFPSVTELHFSLLKHDNITINNLAILSNFKEVKCLCIETSGYYFTSAKDYRPPIPIDFNWFPKLEIVQCSGLGDSINLEKSNITKLYIQRGHGFKNLNKITLPTSLEEIGVSEQPLFNSLKGIEKAVHLKKVYLSFLKNLKEVKLLKLLPYLEVLSLTNCPKINREELDERLLSFDPFSHDRIYGTVPL